jgi:hypothetical protein
MTDEPIEIPAEIQADLERELGQTGQVRHNCAFCQRERSAKDDNHADDCPYWTIGPGSLR